MALVRPIPNLDDAKTRASNKRYRVKVTNLETIASAMYEVSVSASGRMVDPRRGWATVLFTRLCVLVTSLRRQLPELSNDPGESDRWDLSSVAAICRMILECCLLFYYLGVEEISDEEARDRINLFHLHDCTARISLFTNLFPSPEQVEGMKKQREELLERFSESALLASKTERQKNHLLRGDKVMFVIQDDVLDSLGEDKGVFRGFYEVLSAHVHSYPLAYHRMMMGGRGDGIENNAEKDWMGIVVEYTSGFLSRATTQMLGLFDDIPDPRLKGVTVRR